MRERQTGLLIALALAILSVTWFTWHYRVHQRTMAAPAASPVVLVERVAGWTDLSRVAPPLREILTLVMVLPLGGLVTSICRTMIGLRTFGIFAPVLIALSFVAAGWQAGLAVLVPVALVGLVGRRYLTRLKLLIVPRLGLLMTLVVLSLSFSLAGLEDAGLHLTTSALLLPIAVLVMVVERFYITAEEDGPSGSTMLALQTMLVALCCYLAMRWPAVGELLLLYPELHLLSAALFLLMGGYTGYRLTELWRFRDMQGDAPHANLD